MGFFFDSFSFHLSIYLLSLPLGLGSFSSIKEAGFPLDREVFSNHLPPVQCSIRRATITATRSAELASEKEGNFNVLLSDGHKVAHDHGM